MNRKEEIKARVQDFAEQLATCPTSYTIGDHMKKYNISESTAKEDLKVAQPISDAIEDQIFEIQKQKWLDSFKQQ
jgi:hypothetical protein|tara:strand:+ start:2004 stop:2228 length:225 start_codon:yes stop_codon:yes gene_type:complete